MGVKKSGKAKGSFYLKSTTNKKGYKPIYLRYFVNGKYAKRSSDIWINPDDWDANKEVVKPSEKLAPNYNAKLASMKLKVEEQLLAHDGFVNYKDVQRMLDGTFTSKKAQAPLFIDYCNDFNERQFQDTKYGYSVYYNYQKYITKFQKFLEEINQEALTLSNITLNIIERYRSETLKALKKTSANKALAPIIRTVKYALDNGLLPYNIAEPIINKGYYNLKERSYTPDEEDEDDVHYLTKEQFEEFLAYQPTSNSARRTKEIKQIFLFSYYSCGLRLSDIVTLQWSEINMEKKLIDKIQVKTKTKPKIPPRISQKGIDILNEWKQKNLNSRFVFNLLPKNFVFPKKKEDGTEEGKEKSKSLRKAINNVDRTFNQSLNCIGKALQLPFSLTFHCARHTFCVNALSQGLSLHFVSQLMGHSSILATEKTYAKYLQSTIDNEIDKLENIYNQ